MSSAESIARTTDPITLTRFLLAEHSQFKESTGSFAMLLQSVALACKVIANATKQAGLTNLFGTAANQSQNTSGDQQVSVVGKCEARCFALQSGILTHSPFAPHSSLNAQKKLDVLANDVMINCLSYSVRRPHA